MTDRELLELAAKAAKLSVFWGHPSSDCYDHNKLYLEQDKVVYTAREWNPLEDDGDALRLAVRLGIDLLFTTEDVEAVATMHALQEDQEMISPWAMESWTLKNQDPGLATRRAIARAAAEIGRNMK